MSKSKRPWKWMLRTDSPARCAPEGNRKLALAHEAQSPEGRHKHAIAPYKARFQNLQAKKKQQSQPDHRSKSAGDADELPFPAPETLEWPFCPSATLLDTPPSLGSLYPDVKLSPLPCPQFPFIETSDDAISSWYQLRSLIPRFTTRFWPQHKP